MEVLNSPEAEGSVGDIKKEGIKFGITLGVFSMLIMYGSYFLGFDTFVNTQFASAFIPYMIIILLVGGFQLRRRNGGYLSFKEAIKFCFLAYVVAAVINAVGTYILFDVMDKTLTDRTFHAGLDKTRRVMERLGSSQSDINKALGDAEKTKTTTGIKTIFLGFGQGLIIDFVKSLLITLVIRKEKPALK